MSDPQSILGARRDSRPLGLAAVLTAVSCFALSLSVIKWPGVPGSVIAWWRLIGSTILWWVVLLVRRRRTGRPLPSREMWRRMLVPAFFFGLNISIAFTAYTRTSVAHADFIGAMAPLIMMPAGFLLFRERPNWRALSWGILSIVGIAIILFNGNEKGTATLRGDLIAIGGVAMLSSYLLASKRVRGQTDDRNIGTWDFMAMLMPLALITATPVAVATAGEEMWPLSWKAWAAIGILSVLTGMVAHGLLAYAHRSVPIATMSTLQVSQPAISVFLAWVLLGETIAASQLPGMALVLIGMGLVAWATHRTSA